jgi:hypothetical protein
MTEENGIVWAGADCAIGAAEVRVFPVCETGKGIEGGSGGICHSEHEGVRIVKMSQG